MSVFQSYIYSIGTTRSDYTNKQAKQNTHPISPLTQEVYSLKMRSLLLLALLTPVLAAPGVQYSIPTSTSTPTATVAPNAVAFPTPLFTMPPSATVQELKRRGAIVPGMLLNKRQTTCSSGTYTCSDGSGCCKLGSLCFGSGYCYDPS